MAKENVNVNLGTLLLESRILFIGSEVNPEMANTIVSALLYLDSISHDSIKLYINSPGGAVSAGSAIIDTMHMIESPVETVCVGMAASMAAFLLSCGSRGKRYCLPNSTVMIHQPIGGVQGQAAEIKIVATRILNLYDKLAEIMSKNSFIDKETMKEALDRDNYLTPEEALKMGLVDKIIDSPPKAWMKEDNADEQ